MFKADVFILKGDSWSHEEMARARIDIAPLSIRNLVSELVPHELVKQRVFGTRESDSHLALGYVELFLGVLEVQGDALDQQYLDRWAPALGVMALLVRARRERGARMSRS